MNTEKVDLSIKKRNLLGDFVLVFSIKLVGLILLYTLFFNHKISAEKVTQDIEKQFSISPQ